MDDGVTPVDEIMRGLDDLVRQGKILYAGLSNFPAWRIAAAAMTADRNAWAPVAAIQVEYNLLQRTIEREMLPMADAFGLATMAWSPLAGGLLTGKYRRGEKGRATELQSSVLHDEAARNAGVLDALEAAGRDLGAPPSQVAIAWAMAKGVFPVLGPRTLAQLEDNLAGAEIALDAETIARLDQASETPLGYPHELLAHPEQRNVMTGGRWSAIDFPRTTVV
jgi:aryl-alcohol dehydrogenase-like predicted oxidoreductase